MRRLPVPSDSTKTNIVTNNLFISKTGKVVRLIAQEVQRPLQLFRNSIQVFG